MHQSHFVFIQLNVFYIKLKILRIEINSDGLSNIHYVICCDDKKCKPNQMTFFFTEWESFISLR